MINFVLNKKQVSELILENRYQVEERQQFLSRCFESSYPKKEKLPALSFPGGDLGQLALIFSAANVYGFRIDREKVFQTLIKLLGGEKFFHYHINLSEEKFLHLKKDKLTSLDLLITSCFHTKNFFENPKVYNLEKEDIDFLRKKISQLVEKNILPFCFKKEVDESAVLIIYGKKWSVYPQYFLKITLDEVEKVLPVSVFVFHQSLIDERHKILSQRLIKEKVVELYPGCDQEYLYQVLSNETENHLFESLKIKKQNLPVFKVDFKDDGGFEVEEMGNV